MENPADLDASIPWVARGYSNTLQSKKYGRTTKDGETNFLLCAEDDVHLSTDLKTSTPVQKQAQQVRQRPKSASAAYSAYSRTTPPRPQSATVTGGWRKPRPLSAQRPSSGRPWKVLPGEDGKKRRAWSAGPRRPASAVSLNKKSYTLVSRAFEDERLMYEFSPHPNHRFLDRHARCFDHTHIHLQLLLTRPQTACRHCGEFRCPMGDCAYGTNSTVVSPGSRPRSAAGVRDPPETEYEQYIAYTRPARPSTAPPGGRRGLAEREPVTRGHIPHFCNFVQSAILHERDHSTEIHHHDHHHHHHQYSDVDIDRKDSSSQGHGGRRSARPSTEPEYVRPESPAVSEVEVKEEDDWDEKIDVTIVDKENEPEFQNDSEIRNITPPPIPHPPLHPRPKPCSVWMETPPVKKPVPPPLPKPVEKHKPVENPKRVCVKKEKRPVERERQKREMEPPEPVKAAEPEPPPPPPPPEPVEESKPQVKERPVVGPPDLPELKPAERPATPVKQPTPTPPKHPIQGGVDVVKVDPLVRQNNLLFIAY
ncbi:bromodomain-containing protein 4-like [Lingula anatina]|uniref:Bromodomain-containing protein 4-like n=1 Tax=Lingula anatina TaxID=7574 RepID=A0A2R2MT82_LINAN|nr:bromodomain-containing protein 4-like [Lingula anatina]|eukprot:XP_023933237.1 bromodomain-containing protein 4-like [Lingula anatina]